MLDDDVLPEPDLVLRHALFHREHPERHHAAVGETYVPDHLREEPMSLFHEFSYDKVRRLERLSYVYFWTCNVSLKRQFMLEAGMFDERFLYNEDIICGHRLNSHGMHLHFLPSARGQHLHESGDPSTLPAKGRHIGRWHYATVQALPEPAIKEHYGVLSADLPLRVLAIRLLNRTGFRVIDNPATMAVLRLLGANRGKRSRLSDLYHYLIFRRNVVAGYYEARRLAKAGRPVFPDAGRGAGEALDRALSRRPRGTLDLKNQGPIAETADQKKE